MANIPGLKADVYFGDTETPLPDWREESQPEGYAEEESDKLSDDEHQAVVSILGFDPFHDLDGESEEDKDD